MTDSTHSPEDNILYHDFTLRSYEVSDEGRTIILDLVLAAETVYYSRLKFQDVAAYRFMDTGGAVLTDIDEFSLEDAVRILELYFPEERRSYNTMPVSALTKEQFNEYYVSKGFKTWLIRGIGFGGMVVARSLTSIKAGSGTSSEPPGSPRAD